MRNILTSKAKGFLILGLLTACSLVPAPAKATFAQRAVTNGSKSDSGSGAGQVSRQSKAPVLARNTGAAPPKGEIAVKKKPATESKNTISRCWKRLMDNLREVRHAHRKQ